MCNRYFQPPRERINFFRILSVPDTYKGGDVFPRSTGSFLRTSENGDDLELVLGQWGLVPNFAKSKTLTYSTNNARMESVATAASFKHAWAHGQRCIIPADVFWEPCWESGKNEWWSFRRADGAPWGLAGLWNRLLITPSRRWRPDAYGEDGLQGIKVNLAMNGQPGVGEFDFDGARAWLGRRGADHDRCRLNGHREQCVSRGRCFRPLQITSPFVQLVGVDAVGQGDAGN